ncbi:hypothetical protein ColLi_10313 [Colletotrichum liriopes]|uniref:Transmembrane protein n=1 Tax=Colletotrichum liriopes TaxID=708192 RepID=A0AA37LW11_9PEZI|nr:hypothetical protein ColLi_10313 [Colletotrichum liriopes]
MDLTPRSLQEDIDKKLDDLFNRFVPKNDSGSDANWYSQCTEKVKAKWDKEANNTNGNRSHIRNGIVVDISGTRFNDSMTVDDVEDAWGISIGLCKEYCGRDNLNMVTSFNRLAAGSTSYLLPWLALTAQLPYETGSTEADIMSVCVGLGSPVLMAFSLMMTILNKRWIRRRFKYLAGSCEGDGFNQMRVRLKSARIIAEESRQAPTRLSQRHGWLARLVMLDANTSWWREAASSLRSTRRGATLSLYAQLSVAVIAWVLTAIGSLKTKVGDTEEALVLSAGSLWIWLVPVIIGWVLVGTQNKEDTIRTALGNANNRIGVENEETGIEVISDRKSATLADPDTRCVNVPVPTRANRNGRPRMNLGIFDVVGFQRQQGPVFNYARSVSWLNFADRLYMAFEAATDRMKEQNGLSSQPDTTTDDHVRISADCGLAPDMCTHGNAQSQSFPTTPVLSDNGGSRQHLLLAEAPPGHELVEYPSLGEMSPVAMSTFWRHVALSMIVALALQWGTTGWAIYMSYETVVKGLGCRSGSYVIYGILATASCAAMLASAWLSHSTMRGYQYELNTTRHLTGYGTTRLRGAAAVITRLFGQFLLVGNTIWLLVISIFELIGFFDSCYCAGTQLSKGLEHGWILLFKNADALKADTQPAWGTGIGMGFLTIFLAVMIFYLASRQKHE